MGNHAVISKFPHLLHGADYNPEQWLHDPEILKRDIELMQEANMNCVSLGIFSWAALEPQEGVYTFEWMDQIIDRLYEGGIYVILATPTGAKPLWMSEKYPEIRRVTKHMQRNLSGERHNHCYTSPIYREKAKQINTRLAERYHAHPGVILWHLSNEYGGECYCPLCQDAFREWLQVKYSTLQELNRAWWSAFWSHTYTDWSQVQAPVPAGERSIHGLMLDWKRFVTHQTIDFMNAEIHTVKTIAPLLPVTTNLMGFYEPLNYHKFAESLDIVSWDNYPLWHNETPIDTAVKSACSHDLMRSIKKEPFLLMENSPSSMNWTPVSKLKRPGMHLLSAMQALAHGANSVQYFQWRKSRGSFEKFHGAVVGHDGTAETRVFQEVSQVGDYLKRLSPLLMDSQIKPEVAILFDWENHWAIQESQGPRNAGMHDIETILDHYRAFWEKGVQVDLPDMEDDLSPYKLIVAPMLYMYRAGVAEKLRDFVKKGGTLVGTYFSGVVDENDLCYLGKTPALGMTAVFGIETVEIDALYEHEENYMVSNGIIAPKNSYRVTELCEVIHPTTAKTIAVYWKDYYKGQPALTVNQFGKGTAYYLAAKAELNCYRSLYDSLISTLQLDRALPVQLPGGVTAHKRVGTETIVFVENYNDTEHAFPLPLPMQDAISGEMVSELSLPTFGVRILKEIRKPEPLL